MALPRKTDTLYSILDQYTKETITYDKVTLYYDGSSMDDSKTDGVIYRKYGSEYFKRNVVGELNILWFGADPTNTSNSIATFNAAVLMADRLNLNLFIPKGRYRLSSSWIIPGRSAASSILIRGEGARNTILDFTTSTDTICVQYGTPASNTIHGGITDIQIQGTQNAHGLVISSHAPYSAAFNTFSNIYFFKVKDGITFDGLPSNTSSNYQNFFYNMMVEEHWGRGIYCDGAMNVFDGGFIVAPYGTHGAPAAGTGANSCAVYDYGGGNTYNNIPSEDQWLLNGSNTKITRCTIELIQKSVANSSIGDSAFRIGGGGVSIDGFTITTIPNSFIGAIAYIYGKGTSLKNITYLNPGDISQYIITYPVLPSAGSSGTMENVSCPTVYGTNHPALYSGSAEWSFINVLGQGGVNFSRIVDLEFPDAPDFSNLLDKTVGGTVTGFTTINDGKFTNTLELHGIIFDYAGFVILNAVGDDYVPFISAPSSGKVNLTNVGSLSATTATFTTPVVGVAAVGANDFVIKSQLPTTTSFLDTTAGGHVIGYTYLDGGASLANGTEINGVFYDRSSAHFGVNKASDGYLPLVGRDVTGTEAVWNYDNIGTLNPNGNEVNFGGLASAQGFGTKIGATTVNKILPNGLDANNAGITLQYKQIGTFHDGLVISYTGTAIFASTVSASDGTSSTHLVTKSQLDNKKAVALTVAALPTTAGVTYTASDVQALLDRVKDLETKLIAAGLLTA